MKPFPPRRPLGAVLIAAGLALGLTGQPAGAQAPDSTVERVDTGEATVDAASTPQPTLPSADELTPGLPVPDDTGVVHSWALAPGDGTTQAGERPNLSYEIAPGGQVEDLVTLYNFSNVPLTFGVYATDAFNNDDGSFNLLAAAEEPKDVGTWLSLPADSVTVPAGKQATFPITIKVPVDATPGDHVGALLASSTAVGTGPDNAVVTLDRRTGTRLYVRVAGQLRAELAVEELTTSYDASANPFGGSAALSYRIVNRGNVRLAGTQQVSVAGPFGLFRKQLDVEDVPELLPGESIEVSKSFDDVSATGLMFAEVELDPRAPVGDDELEEGSTSASTRAVPYTLLAILIAVIFVLLARRAYRRHRNEVAVMNEAGDVVIVPVEVIDVTDERQPTGR
jgi:Bacterial protein of unknown function (DUF916)